MLYRLIWIFFIYAFLGWCTEVSYAALVTGKFVNRGFLNGPVCPVYGFGVVIVLSCLTPTSEKSSITELCEWMGRNPALGNPFEKCIRREFNATMNYAATYTDIMLYTDPSASNIQHNAV